MIENWKISTQIRKILFFFHQNPQPLYDILQNEIEILEFVQGVNFGFINSLKNDGTKYLFIFDDSYATICNFKDSVGMATTGRHRSVSTIYIKHNVFHQSKFGRDVELQNTHIVLFKPPRDVHQVSTLNVQSGLGSTLIDWYLRCNIRSFWSFAESFVPANKRSHTLLHK